MQIKDNGGDKIPFEEIEYWESIGQGFSGTVQKVAHKGKLYALKTITKSENECEHISNEIAQMISLRQHPNIVKMFNYYIQPNEDLSNNYDFHMLLELGTFDLSKFIIAFPDFFNNKDNVEDFLIQLFNAILYLSLNCLAHRDVKLDNILCFLSEQNEVNNDLKSIPVFKLNDFGCIIDIIKNDTRPIRGFPDIRPPELNKRKLTCFNYHSHDLYSLGILILQVIGVIIEPDELTGKIKANEYEHAKNIFTGQAYEKVNSDLVKTFLDYSLEYHGQKRLKPVELYQKLFLQQTPYRDSFYIHTIDKLPLCDKPVYIKSNPDKYFTVQDQSIAMTDEIEHASQCTISYLNNGKYLIKCLDSGMYLSISHKNYQLLKLSKNTTCLEEWTITPTNGNPWTSCAFFIRSWNFSFLKSDKEGLSLNKLIQLENSFQFQEIQ